MTTPTAPTPHDIEQLRAERDAALSALENANKRTTRGGPVRRTIAGVLVVLFAVLLPVTVTATWAHRTVLNTDQYVKTVTPIAADPAVTAAVSRQITTQLYATLDPQAKIATALPAQLDFLAGPIANAARDNVQSAVNKVLDSSQFQQLWVQANRFAHAQLVAVLRHDTKTVQLQDDQVVLNLVPVLNAALAQSQDFITGVVGRPVTLPTITGDELPAAACQKIATALDRPVPATCGQIPLFKAQNLSTARRVVQAFDRGVLALLIVTPLLAVAALVISRRRRRTLLQLAVGGGLAMVVVRRVLMWQQDQLVTTGRPENKAARTAIVHGVLNGFFDLTVWFVVGALVVTVVALLTGPYRWAVAMRHGVVRGVSTAGHLVAVGVTGARARSQDEATMAWIRGHFDALRIGGVVVAAFLLLAFSVGFWGFLVIAALLAAYELGLHRLRPPSEITLPSQPSGPAPG
jgi:hypothetical protein